MRNIIYILMWASFSASILSAQELEYFIDKALEGHPSLESWEHWTDAKQNEVSEVSSWMGPELQAGYGLFPVETRVGPQIFRFGISQPIKWSGLQNAQRNVKKEELQILEAKRSLTEREVIFKVKNQYLSLFIIQQKRDYLQDFLRLYEEVRMDRIRQMESRTGHYSDVLLVERSMKDIERRLDQLAFDWESQLTQFLYWTGVTIQDSIQLTTEFEIDGSVIDNAEWHIDQYPSLLSLDYEQEKIQSNIKLNQWSSYPQLMVGLDYVVNAARQDVDIPKNGRDAIMPRVGVTLPFLYGKYDHAKQRLEAEALAVGAQKENEYAWLRSLIQSTIHERRKAVVNYQMLEDLIRKTEEIIDITKAQIGAEHTAFAKFWDYQKEIVTYQLQQLDALEEVHRNNFIIEKYTNQ